MRQKRMKNVCKDSKETRELKIIKKNPKKKWQEGQHKKIDIKEREKQRSVEKWHQKI